MSVLGKPIPPKAPAAKPRITPVPGRPGIWQDQQGKLETWLDQDTRKPTKPPSKDTGIKAAEPDIDFDSFIIC